MSLSKAEFLAIGACKVIEHKMNGSNRCIRLRGLTALQGGELIKLVKNKTEPLEMHARAIIMSAIDDNNQPLFAEDELPSVLAMKSDVVMEIGGAVMDLSGMSDDKKNSVRSAEDSID